MKLCGAGGAACPPAGPLVSRGGGGVALPAGDPVDSEVGEQDSLAEGELVVQGRRGRDGADDAKAVAALAGLGPDPYVVADVFVEPVHRLAAEGDLVGFRGSPALDR